MRALIHVKYIDYRTSDERLHEIFAAFGRVKSIDRRREYDDAFVEMYNESEANAAIAKLHWTDEPSGNVLSVTKSGYGIGLPFDNSP